VAGGLQARVLSVWLASFLNDEGFVSVCLRGHNCTAPQTLSNNCEKHSTDGCGLTATFFLAYDECAINCSRRQTVCTEHVVPANVHGGEKGCDYRLALSWSATELLSKHRIRSRAAILPGYGIYAICYSSSVWV